MTINYTTLLGLAKPVTGTETGAWGDVVNDSITSLIEDAVANAATISVTAGNVTLTTTSGSSNQARMSALILTGTPGATRNVVAPSQSKIYVVLNQSDSSVVIKGSATTGVTVVTGEKALVAWSGTDFVKVASTSISNLTGTLPVANGGTGQTTYTDGQLLIGNTTGNTLTKATLTAGSGVSITNGNGSITIASTGSGGTVTSVAQSFTGGLISVSGSPITGSGTLALTVAGTSGGIPYFSSASTWATSAALAANAIVIGGGAGAAPSTTTTGTGVLTALGNTANATGGFTTINGTATLTNKRIDPRVTSAASASSLTPDISAADIYAYTALAANLTINAPTGTPVDGDKLIFRLLDNGVARTLTWNATYTVVGVTLPTTTTANKTTYVGCIYNANNTRWDVIAVTTQA